MTQTPVERKKRKIRLPKLHVKKNTLIALMTIVFDAALLFIMWRVSRFAALDTYLFIKLNLAVLCVIAFINVVAVLSIVFKKKYLYIFSIVLLVLCVGISGYGLYALNAVETSLENMTKTVIEDSVDIVLICNTKGSDAVILSETDLDGKVIAVPAETQLAEAVKERMNEQGITPEYTECSSYVEEAVMLINGEADCIAAPASWRTILEEEEGISSHFDDFSVILEFDADTTTVNTAGADKDLTKEPFTILLEGDSDGLSDTIIMVSVNPQSMDITMTSIARDSYVPITCSGWNSSKINAAHMYGGIGCMIDTVNALTGVEFDYYVEVNFQAIVSIVDALGGIQVNNYIDFVGQSYTDEKSFHDVEMPVGLNVTLNGEQALAWVRERKAFADGDFARQRHQQEFLKIVLEKVMATRDINTLLKLLEAAGDNLNTNMSIEQMTTFLSYAINKASRYYDQNSISGVFNIKNWRITGYNDTYYDAGLGMDLYIYRVWSQACTDSYYEIENNLVTNAEPEIPEQTNWDGEEGYEKENVTYDWY